LRKDKLTGSGNVIITSEPVSVRRFLRKNDRDSARGAPNAFRIGRCVETESCIRVAGLDNTEMFRRRTVGLLRMQGRSSKCAPNLRLETPLPHSPLFSSKSVIGAELSAGSPASCRDYFPLQGSIQMASIRCRWRVRC